MVVKIKAGSKPELSEKPQKLKELSPRPEEKKISSELENVALTSFINKIVDLKKYWELKNKFTLENYDLRPRNLSQTEKKELVQKITEEFKVKNLHKGATEVFNAISYIDLKPTQKVYIAGYLDLAYEEALIKNITQVNRKTQVIRIDKSYKSLVHDCIKDVNLKNVARVKSRRAFNCRIFVV